LAEHAPPSEIGVWQPFAPHFSAESQLKNPAQISPA
jgi:hypothetical protein